MFAGWSATAPNRAGTRLGRCADSARYRSAALPSAADSAASRSPPHSASSQDLQRPRPGCDRTHRRCTDSAPTISTALPRRRQRRPLHDAHLAQARGPNCSTAAGGGAGTRQKNAPTARRAGPPTRAPPTAPPRNPPAWLGIFSPDCSATRPGVSRNTSGRCTRRRAIQSAACRATDGAGRAIPHVARHRSPDHSSNQRGVSSRERVGTLHRQHAIRSAASNAADSTASRLPTSLGSGKPRLLSNGARSSRNASGRYRRQRAIVQDCRRLPRRRQRRLAIPRVN